MESNKKLISTAVLVASSACFTSTLHAAQFFDGALLGIDAGGNPDAAGQCTTGSCFGMEVSPNFWIWTMVGPGNDGGFVIGKNQLSGGQETGPSGSITTPGDMTAAWFFFGAYGTFYADNAQNYFSDVSNDGTTTLNDFNVAWNGGVIPMGNGSVDDYTLTPDSAGSGTWSLDYSAVVSTGNFQGVNFRMLVRGRLDDCISIGGPIVVTCTPPQTAPIVNDISINADSGFTTLWAPDYTDDIGDVHTCVITSNASNGNATVNADCSGGTYTSGAGFEGIDSFEYSVTDQAGLSATGAVVVTVVYPDPCPGTGPAACSCSEEYPLRQVTTIGGGQSPTANASLQTTFTGHFITLAGLTSGGKNTVKICPGTTVDFTVTSTVGDPACIINSAATASTGTLAIGDKIICTNKPDASDTDRFSIKSGF